MMLLIEKKKTILSAFVQAFFLFKITFSGSPAAYHRFSLELSYLCAAFAHHSIAHFAVHSLY